MLLISLFRSFLFFNIALKAGTRMHNAMAHRCPSSRHAQLHCHLLHVRCCFCSPGYNKAYMPV